MSSISVERRIQYYPKPKHCALIKAYAQEKGISYSAAISEAVGVFFNTMNEADKSRLLNLSKSKK